MDIVIWILAGAFLGWLGYAKLDFNQERGLMVSVIIGAVGGFFGGKIIAPMFSGPAVVGSGFNVAGLLVAAFVAALFLYAGNFVHDRWGV